MKPASRLDGIEISLIRQISALAGPDAIHLGLGEPNVEPDETLREMARQIGVHPSWIYREIGRRTVAIKKDPRYGCYLFPRTEQAVTQMNRLKQGELRHVSFPKGHCTG